MKFVLQTGYPPERKTAPLHRRYVGMFYYSDYFRKWDEVLGVTEREWIVREVGSDRVRRHCTPLWADRFADQPFEV